VYRTTPGACFPHAVPSTLPYLEAQGSSWVSSIQHRALYVCFQTLPSVARPRERLQRTTPTFSVLFVSDAITCEKTAQWLSADLHYHNGTASSPCKTLL